MIALHLNRLDEWEELAGLESTLTAAVRAALETTDHPSHGELSITFVTDDEMRALNKQYLSRERTTDVIAFELGGSDQLLGDIYISPAAAVRAATDEGIEANAELIRLAVHGTLHALGHDHPEGDDRWTSPMFGLQEGVVRRFTDPGSPARARTDD